MNIKMKIENDMWNPISIVWEGWEYETPNGLHMYMSKRHLFINDKAICGVVPPPGFLNQNHGDGACRKCRSYAIKNNIEY